MKRARFASAFVICILITLAAPCLAAQVVVTPTVRLYNPDRSVAGFGSNEPGLYFLIASKWTLAKLPNAVTLLDLGAGQYDLRLTLSPSYASAVPLVSEIRAVEPRALFFPLPSRLDEVSLSLPEALARPVAQLAPEGGVATPIAVYYRLRLDEAGLSALRQLARGGVTLQGAVTYSFAANGTDEQTTAPLSVHLPTGALDLGVAPPATSPTAWLEDILHSAVLDAPGALDGVYDLGQGFGVTLERTRVRGDLRDGTYNLARVANAIRLSPTQENVLEGQIAIHVRELSLDLSLSYSARLAMTLDLDTVRVTVDSLSIGRAALDGHSSPFYGELLSRLTREQALLTKLSNALTRELQARILSKTLFGINDLP